MLKSFTVQNAHAAAGGQVDEETSAALEEQIKQQLAGGPTKDIDLSGENLLPAANLTRRNSTTPDSLSPPRKVNRLRQCRP